MTGPTQPGMTAAQRTALVTRPDLLAAECGVVRARHLNWRGRLREMGDYGRHGGGSAADRRAVVEAMAAIEQEARDA